MARKKTAEPATDPHGRVTLVNLKGPISDREYLERITRKTGVPLSTMVRRGIALWVAKHGHEPAPGDWIEDDPAPDIAEESSRAKKSAPKRAASR